jgi:spermidine synthase
MAYASDDIDPISSETLALVTSRYNTLGKLKYYNPEIHRAAFALPNFAKAILD